MTYVSPEYRERLASLANTLCEPFRSPVQDELDFDGSNYAEVADCIIERTEVAQVGRTATFGWDSEGTYLTRD